METKNKKYICDNTLVMSEWDWEKNNALGLNPRELSYGSAKKVWWQCEKGHEWEASPNHRSRGRGCPVCAEEQRGKTRIQKWIEKKGSLASLNPTLAAQWHPTKNGEITAQDVTCSSGKKAWWICEKGHEWEARINSRNTGAGCPICSGHKILVGYNDLATVKPEIAAQWHPTKNGALTPQDVTISNGKKRWWKCENGHEWATSVANRSAGCGCPVCVGRKVLVGYNDLETVNPMLAAEWHPTKNGGLTPKDVTIASNKKIWWQCNKGHEWKTNPSHRKRGTGCPICSGENKTSFPEQAIFFYCRKIGETNNRYKVDYRTEIDVYLPKYKVGIEYDGAYFHKGKIAEQREQRKQEKLNKLGICLIRVKETNDSLMENNSEYTLYSKARPTDKELTETIKKLFILINKITRSTWDIDIDVERDRSEIYEQYINANKETSLFEMNKNLAKEWNFSKNGSLLPEQITVGSQKKVWWICKKGHEWQAAPSTRKKGVGCPVCSGHKVLVGYNDITTTHPKIAEQWHPTKNGKITAADVVIGSNKKAWWRCEKGHEWETVISHRQRGSGCPICSGHKVLASYNDLETTNPHLAKQWHPTKNGAQTPKDFTKGSDKKAWWICKEGHEWEAVISSRNAGVGCPYCAHQKVWDGYNDLATVNPELAAQWHPTKNEGKTPSNFMPGSNKKAWWICEKGHEWEAVISSRNTGRGCPYCAQLPKTKK